MEKLTDLKPMLATEQANIFYLENCRIMERGGCIRYLHETEDKENEFQYGNIPLTKPTTILLGGDTSISQSTMGKLANAGVQVGINSEATALLTGTETEWITPVYAERPTEYLQGWMSFWFDHEKRLIAAKQLAYARIQFMKSVWANDASLIAEGFNLFDDDIYRPLIKLSGKIEQARNVEKLLQLQSEYTYRLYKIGDYRTRHGSFMRDKNANDSVNAFLNHGYYLANGMAACALWVLGIPHDFSVMHGTTRRNILVLDIAKLIKDTLILPWAFICAKDKVTQKEFRQLLLEVFDKYRAFEFMFEQIKSAAMLYQNEAGDAA